MLNLGTPELLVIVVLALLVLGPTRLPDAARSVGRTVSELRRLGNGFNDEVRRAMEDARPAVPAGDAPSRDGDGTSGRPRRPQPLRAQPSSANGSVGTD